MTKEKPPPARRRSGDLGRSAIANEKTRAKTSAPATVMFALLFRPAMTAGWVCGEMPAGGRGGAEALAPLGVAAGGGYASPCNTAPFWSLRLLAGIVGL